MLAFAVAICALTLAAPAEAKAQATKLIAFSAKKAPPPSSAGDGGFFTWLRDRGKIAKKAYRKKLV